MSPVSYFVAVTLLQVALGAPVLKLGSVNVDPTISSPDQSPQCVEFSHPYCSKFGYTHAMFPNPRQVDLQDFLPHPVTIQDYMDNAASEFAEFFPLLDSECSDKLGTFLCFFYFPFCHVSPYGTTTIFPCKSLCEEVTDLAGKCEEQLNRVNLTWKLHSHFNCSDYTYQDEKLYKEESDQCANNVQMTWDKCADFGIGCSNDSVEEAPVSETPTVPTEATPKCELCSDSYQCPLKCKYRKNINGKSFERNSYNFAVRARLNSNTTYHCRRALNLTVVEQYDIKSESDCISSPTLEKDSVFMAISDGLDCPDCLEELELETGIDYFLAGHHRKATDAEGCPGVTLWEITDNPIISKWDSLKNSHKLEQFVDNGNAARC